MSGRDTPVLDAPGDERRRAGPGAHLHVLQAFVDKDSRIRCVQERERLIVGQDLLNLLVVGLSRRGIAAWHSARLVEQLVHPRIVVVDEVGAGGNAL